jgi:hypothetical protein
MITAETTADHVARLERENADLRVVIENRRSSTISLVDCMKNLLDEVMADEIASLNSGFPQDPCLCSEAAIGMLAAVLVERCGHHLAVFAAN